MCINISCLAVVAVGVFIAFVAIFVAIVAKVILLII